MKKSNRLILFLIFIVFTVFLIGCKPQKMEFEIYTSDMELAATGEIVNIPLTVELQILGEDTENLMPKGKNILKQYLNEDAEFKLSKGDFGDIMIIKCTVPMSTPKALDTHMKKTNRPVALTIEDNIVTLQKTRHFKKMKKNISGVHMMLGAQLPAHSTFFRFVGDMRQGPEIKAIAIFSDNKPVLDYSQVIERRQSTEIEFKGGSDSVYSEIPIHFTAKFE